MPMPPMDAGVSVRLPGCLPCGEQHEHAENPAYHIELLGTARGWCWAPQESIVVQRREKEPLLN